MFVALVGEPVCALVGAPVDALVSALVGAMVGVDVSVPVGALVDELVGVLVGARSNCRFCRGWRAAAAEQLLFAEDGGPATMPMVGCRGWRAAMTNRRGFILIFLIRILKSISVVILYSKGYFGSRAEYTFLLLRSPELSRFPTFLKSVYQCVPYDFLSTSIRTCKKAHEPSSPHPLP